LAFVEASKEQDMRKRIYWTLCVTLLVAAWSVRMAFAQEGGTTVLVSVASDGTPGNSRSGATDLSQDGRYIVFYSWSDNLVVSDTNRAYDIFVHDLETRETRRVSVSSEGTEGNDGSDMASISADGRYIAFDSEASDLVSDDTNESTDVFVHDQQTGETERVSVGSDGTQGDGLSYYPSISADGRFIAFTSGATNLTSEGVRGAFVHDRETGETTLVSRATDGSAADNYAGGAAISGNGRFVAFESTATNLVEGDESGDEDMFVHDRETGETTIIPLPPSSGYSKFGSSRPAISDDGRFVAFGTDENLLPSDSNYCESGFGINCADVYVYDREMGELSHVSVASDGTGGNGYSGSTTSPPFISADGRFVTFSSHSTNLVPDDTNEEKDGFVHDRLTGETILVSITPEGGQFEEPVYENPPISGDGQRVAFAVGNQTYLRIRGDVPTSVGVTSLTTGPRGSSLPGLMLVGGLLLLFGVWRRAKK
jgi:Tol biopolymer transport system component